MRVIPSAPVHVIPSAPVHVIPSAPVHVIPSAPMHVIPSAAEESKALAGNTTSGRRPLSTYLTRP